MIVKNRKYLLIFMRMFALHTTELANSKVIKNYHLPHKIEEY